MLGSARRPLTLGSFESVVHEHCNGHGSNTSGNRGNVRGDLAGRLKVNITDKALTGFFGSVGNVVGADINHNRARLQPLATYKLGLADSSDNDISLADDSLNVLGTRVALGDGRVLLSEQSADRGADNVASAENDDVGTSEVETGGLDELDSTRWGARGEEGLADSAAEETNVFRVETVNVLGDIHAVNNSLLLSLTGTFKRELDEDTRDLFVLVGFLHRLKDSLDTSSLERTRLFVRGNLDVLDSHTRLFGGLELHANVSRGSSARAELKDDKMRLMEGRVGRMEVGDGLGDGGTDLPVGGEKKDCWRKLA